MTRLSQLQNKFKGQLLDDRLYLPILVSNGTYDFSSSDYIESSSATDNVFYIVQHIVNGVPTMVISANTDHGLSSPSQGMAGAIYFTKKDNFSIQSASDGISGSIQLYHNSLNKMYLGQPNSLVGDNGLLIFKNNTDTTVPPPSAIDNDNKSTLRSVFYEGVTTTDSLTTTSVTLDVGSYTSSQSTNLIPTTGLATLSNGVFYEHVLVTYYDPVSNKARIERGYMDSVALTWAGTFTVTFWYPTQINNYDSLSANDNLVAGFDVYLIPHSKDAYLRSYMTLNRMYDYDYYTAATPVWSFETGNLVYRSEYFVDNFLFLNNVTPEALTSNTVNGKYVLKDSNQFSNYIFSNPYEADQGYIYDYCTTNQTCGTCMGNTPDNSNNCMVDPTAYDSNSDQNPLTYGPNYGSENANWNNRNKFNNFYIPLGLVAGAGFFVLVMFIVYVGVMGTFIHECQTGHFNNHDFTDELRITKTTTGAMAGLSAIVFIGTVIWVIMSIVEGEKGASKRFFPTTNYKRSIYNPPPGYTFVNAPSSSN